MTTKQPYPTRPIAFYERVSHGRPAYWMAFDWHDEIALGQMIESRKYDLNKPDLAKKTLLMRLIKWGNVDLVIKTLDAGVNTLVRDIDGKTAFDYAHKLVKNYPQSPKTIEDMINYPADKEDYEKICCWVQRATIAQRQSSQKHRFTQMALAYSPKRLHKPMLRTIRRLTTRFNERA